MLDRFYKYNTENQLFTPESKILLTVSGGVDSIVLCDLFHKAGISFAIAHCNFGLRGKESEEDETFVKELASTYHASAFVKKFNTKTEAEKLKISTQMVARELRYSWFHELINDKGFDFIATAHHNNDALETVLLNLTKGTGISGLHGIRAKSGKLIRPLLFADKNEIIAYAKEQGLTWREDSSNQSVKYQRNILRNEVIPLLKKINPAVETTVLQTIDKVSAVENIFRTYLENKKLELVRSDNGIVYIDLFALNKEQEPLIILSELIKEYQFNYSQAKEILSANGERTGKKFISSSHVLWIDRSELIITAGEQNIISQSEIPENIKEININGQKLKFTKKSIDVIPDSKNVACLNLSKLVFPLQVRAWKHGDWFYPLGMKQKKKLSDFFIDIKLPLHIKETTMIITSGEDIVWVVGLRIDERYKINKMNEECFYIEIK